MDTYSSSSSIELQLHATELNGDFRCNFAKVLFAGREKVSIGGPSVIGTTYLNLEKSGSMTSDPSVNLSVIVDELILLRLRSDNEKREKAMFTF